MGRVGKVLPNAILEEAECLGEFRLAIETERRVVVFLRLVKERLEGFVTLVSEVFGVSGLGLACR